MLRPRERYPVDQHFTPIDERTGRPDPGPGLETAVLVERVRWGLVGAVAGLLKTGVLLPILDSITSQPPVVVALWRHPVATLLFDSPGR